MFRDPDPAYAGVGTALLRRVLVAAADEGLPEVGLSVTHGNPAVKVYRRLGFVTTRSLVTVIV